MSELKDLLINITEEKREKIIPENIKAGVTIFDVIGTHEGGADTSDANATKDDIARGKSAYVKGLKIDGDVPIENTDGGIWAYSKWANGHMYPANNDAERTITFYTKFYNNNRMLLKDINHGMAVDYTSIINTLGLTADKIVSGNNILGIDGIAEIGTDTSDADATADDIVLGKSAYVKGEKIIGTIPASEIMKLSETITNSKPYTELEYITSDGLAYIDTGVKASSTIGVELNVKCGNTTATAFFGAWNDSKGIIFGQAYYSDSVNGYAMAANGSWVFAENSSNFDTTVFHKFVYDPVNDIYTIDGKYVNLVKNTGLDLNLWIFRSYEWTEMGSDISVSRCKLYDNGTLIKDYIPVIRKADNVICMYDLVNNEFIENAGTGTFTAGPEMIYDLTGTLNLILVEKETKILPENIKAGVQVFDVVGTLDGDVSQEEYDAVVAERDSLKEQVATLQAELTSQGLLMDNLNGEEI